MWNGKTAIERDYKYRRKKVWNLNVEDSRKKAYSKQAIPRQPKRNYA